MASALKYLALTCVLFLVFGELQTKSIDESLVDVLNTVTTPRKMEMDADGLITLPGLNKRLIELDMVVPEGIHGERRKRAGWRFDVFYWPNNKVPYEISTGFSETDVEKIRTAMDELEERTCIKFEERSEDDVDYVSILSGLTGLESPTTRGFSVHRMMISRCWSYVGRWGGRQELNLQPGIPGCVFHNIIVHELIHALGYFHEQSRPDRNNFVEINFDNIEEGFEHNFDFYSEFYINSLSIPYDYLSVMHYGSEFFAAVPGTKTIRTLDPAFQDKIGTMPTLSFRDAAGLNGLYDCAASCGAPTYSSGDPEYYLDEECEAQCIDTDGFGIVECPENETGGGE